MPLNVGTGNFKPYAKYNSKADKWLTAGDEEIGRPTFVADLANIATGWFRFREGQAPERRIDPSLDRAAPNPGEDYVQHLLGARLDGCHDGKVELAWTDAGDGKLRHAASFGTDQLDELVERAMRENRVPGQNVYIGVALRKPDIPPFGRCTDSNFLALPVKPRCRSRRRSCR